MTLSIIHALLFLHLFFDGMADPLIIDSKVYTRELALHNCNVNKAKKAKKNQQTKYPNMIKKSRLMDWDDVFSFPGILLLPGYPGSHHLQIFSLMHITGDKGT